jgi:hypothetical protein
MSKAVQIDAVWIPELERSMRLERDSMRRVKLQALWMVARGSVTRVEIVCATGLSVSSLRLLVIRFKALGMACLEDARVSNTRPRLVSDFALPEHVRSARAVQDYLIKSHGVHVSFSTARRLLQRATRDIAG